MRSAVILLDSDRLALIKRMREGRVYYVFPGGTVEAGETPQAAAIREAYEELGVHVALSQLVAVVTFGQKQQYFYQATILDGDFGTGTGAEFFSDSTSTRGSYQPIWLPRQQWLQADIRPHALIQLLLAKPNMDGDEPVYLREADT
jgi:8-oxo-dGTP diphosphatase